LIANAFDGFDSGEAAVPAPISDRTAGLMLQVYRRCTRFDGVPSRLAGHAGESTSPSPLEVAAGPTPGSKTGTGRRARPPARIALAAIGLCSLLLLAIPAMLPARGTLGFVSRNLTGLQADGRDFRFTGLNIPDATGAPCWKPSDLGASLTAIGQGQQVARVYAFQRTATTDGIRDWRFIDRMLSVFRALDQRVILVLTDQWKGQPCADSATDRTLDWYHAGYRTTTEGATTYRDWVSQIVTRYRNDPTIAFWQLVNEADARNPDGTCTESSARVALRGFADDVGGLIKSLDSNHLVSLGTTSGECGSNEADYGYIYASPPIDLCDYHDYGFNSSPMSNTDLQNGLRISLDRCHAAGKALFVGEVGVDFTSLSPPTTAERASLFEAKFEAQFKAGSVGELIWRWSATFHSDQGLEVAPRDPALAVLNAR
jgi:hypothetical protein